MRKFMTWTATVATLASGFGLVAAVPAQAATGDGPYQFGGAPTRVFDDSVAGGQSVPIGGGAQFVNLSTSLGLGANQTLLAGQLLIGPCGGAATTVASHWDVNEGRSELTYAPAGSCVTSTTAVRLTIDRIATETAPQSGGERYIAYPASVPALDTVAPKQPVAPQTVVATTAPADATRVAVRLALEGEPGNLTAYACGTPVPAASNVFTTGPYEDNIAYVPIDAARNLCLQATTTGTLRASVDVLGYFTDAQTSGGGRPPTFVFKRVPAPGLTPIAPTRVLDTRKGLGAPAGKVAAGGTLTLNIAQYLAPESTAVVLNLTATDADGPGYLTAYPCGGAVPEASNVNFGPGQNVPNLVNVKLGADGTVCIFAFAATHVIADLAGTFDDGGGDQYGAVTPARILDTRAGVGAPAAKLAGGQSLRLQVTGTAGVPAGATAVTLNLTATEADGPGFLTAYPCDALRPEASNVNYVAGQNVPNLATVKLAADGSLCIYALASTHVIADVAGYFGPSAAAGYLAVPPVRLLDTRQDGSGDPIAAGVTLALPVTDDAAGTSAVTLNLTVTAPTGPGFLTAYPCDQPRPDVSNVNYVAGQDVANLATVKTAADGTVCLYALATTHVIADLAGFMDTAGVFQEALRVD
jgi:hypothetical protein